MEKTLISEDLEITGNVRGSAAIDVAGRIDGDVEGASIDILQGGSVTGAVKVTTAQIRGKLSGSLKAGTVELHAGAEVAADITAQDLQTQKGVKIKGKLAVSPSG